MSGAAPIAILVAGGFHGGWCWRRVAEPLREQGWRVYTPSLTGLADRAHLLTRAVNLETHVCDITGLIMAEELENVILCGHSAAGSVITVAADRLPERIAGLCYLDASMPLDGQVLLRLHRRLAGRAGCVSRTGTEVRRWLVHTGRGTV